MSVVISIVVMLLIFCVTALVHEWGHFIAARIFKITVLEFSVFMGPRLCHHKSKKTGTDFSLRLLPLGGYCAFADDLTEEDKKKKIEAGEEIPATLGEQAWWKRAIVYSAGVFMNVVLALVIAVVIVSITGFNSNIQKNIDDNSIAKAIGIENGDEIIKIGKIDVANFTDYSLGLTAIKDTSDEESVVKKHYDLKFKKQDGTIVKYSINRFLYYEPTENNTYELTKYIYQIIKVSNGEQTTYVFKGEINYFDDEKQIANCNIRNTINARNVKNTTEDVPYSICATLGNGDFETIKTYNPFKLIKYGFIEMVTWVKSVYIGLNWIITGQIGLEALSGPVGMTSMVNDVVVMDNVSTGLKVETLVYMLGLISANLAVMNFIPFPGLDGFYMFMVIFEVITRKKLPTKVQTIVSYVGLGLLLLLALVIAISDIVKLV